MGYIGYSMSENAAMAYDEGEKPLSKWTKQVLIDAIIEDSDWTEAELKKAPLAVLREMFLYYDGWHHTGKMFNETSFYALDEDVMSKHDTAELSERITEYKAEKKAARAEKAEKHEEQLAKAFIKYEEWHGTRNYGHFVEHDEYAIIRGNVAYLADGKTKRLSGSHILDVKHLETAPEGSEKTFESIFNAHKALRPEKR